jgi:hypothetical protein
MASNPKISETRSSASLQQTRVMRLIGRPGKGCLGEVCPDLPALYVFLTKIMKRARSV